MQSYDTSQEIECLRRMLRAIRVRPEAFDADAPLAVSMARTGRAFSGELMLVGRALNGGWIEITQRECSQDETIDRKLKELFALSVPTAERCPMKWVTESWSRTEEKEYSTGRSPFWRCAKGVALGLGLSSEQATDWPSHLVWTNLYKISPSDGGNPFGKLGQMILSECVSQLHAEIAARNPKRVLYLTGLDWKPFLQTGSFAETTTKHVRAIGKAHDRTSVVATHPQGKNETDWVAEVLEAFR